MFRIDNYIEAWAQIYKPISHKPELVKERRVLRAHGLEQIADLVKSFTYLKSPSVLVLTQNEGELGGSGNKFIHTQYSIFMMVKQESASNLTPLQKEISAADAKEYGFALAQDLLAYIERDKRVNKNKDLEGLQLENSVIHNVPLMLGSWWLTELHIENLIPRNICVEQEKYHIPIK